MFKQFLFNDSGAITVDWVTMAAATVGLSLSSAAAVRVGTSDMGASIAESLSNAAVALMGTVNARVAGFEDGDFSGWSVGRMGYSDELGNFLGPFAGSEDGLTNRVTFPEGTTEATITFDLLLLDSWDGTSPIYSDVSTGGRGDGLSFLVNGVEIDFTAMTNGSSSNPTGSVTVNGSTYSYSMTRSGGGELYTHSDRSTSWQDSTWRVTLTADSPPPEGFDFTINGSSNQITGDESFGIDNYRVDAVTP